MEREDAQPRRARPVTFGELSAFLAVIAAGIYVVGLVSLWFPIVRTYNQGFFASWYAVSLVQKTVVAGQGVALLHLPFVILVIVAVSVLWHNFVNWAVHRKRVRMALYLLGIAVFGVGIVWYLEAIASPGDVIDSPLEWVALFIFANGGALAVSLLLSSETLRLSGEHRLPVLVSGRRLLAAVAVFLGLSFLAALAASVDRKPPLPSVSVTGAISAEGKLLAHVDLFWYIFDEQGTLVALPDEEVTEVRISS